MNRLDILKHSLAKKSALFEQKLAVHMDDVRSANGQPLNDKRNGAATMSRWEKQNDALRSLKASIEKTKNAIEREEAKIANVAGFDAPECLREMLNTGVITQWRKHPRFFFVKGVEKARIVVCEDGTIDVRYVKEIPTQEQYSIFREVVNSAWRLERSALNSASASAQPVIVKGD